MIIEAGIGAVGAFAGSHIIRKVASADLLKSPMLQAYVGTGALLLGTGIASLVVVGESGWTMLEHLNNPLTDAEGALVVEASVETLMVGALGAAAGALFEYWITGMRKH